MVAAAKPTPSARKVAKRPAKLRKSIKPGTIVILLSGHFRGKRAIFLKQLSSGLLLVTGPFNVNGVPLRRVNQRYVIATSTSVDLGKADVGKIDDAYFARDKKAKAKKDEEGFFAKPEEGKEAISDAKKAQQKALDAALAPAIAKDKILKKYLKARFSLSSGMKPHEMAF